MEIKKTMKNLFNEIFQNLYGKEKTPVVVKECFAELMKTNPNDEIIFQVFCYFFPKSTCFVQNTPKEFWFQKYESSEQYTEFNIAFDLLTIMKAYLENKNRQKAEEDINGITYKLSDYKNVDYYFLLTSKYAVSTLIHLLSFFHKDKDYFKKYLDVEIGLNDDLTDAKTLDNLFCGKTITKEELNAHKYYYGIIKQQMKENRLMKLAIKELQENKEKSDEKFKEIEEQLEQIHLRDTIKYSIRYIYRLFYPKFGKNQVFQ